MRVIEEPEIAAAIRGTVVRELEDEVKRLTARTVELEDALSGAGLPIPPGDGTWRLAMFRKLLIVRDLALLVSGPGRGYGAERIETARSDLLRTIEESFALTPICREGDHGAG